MKDFLCALWRDEDGQATTEYVLLLSVTVGLCMSVFKILRPAMEKLTENLGDRMDNMLFKPGAMHRLKISP